MSHLVGDPQPVQKVTIISRGRALGYTLNTPQEDRYLQTKEELVDLLRVLLAGRAAEQVVFDRITNGAANDLERAPPSWRGRWCSSTEWATRSTRARCVPTTTP